MPAKYSDEDRQKIAQLGLRIARARARADVTQAMVAAKLGHPDASTVARWETGRQSPYLTELADLADYLRVPIDHLLRGN